ncbi:MAG: hypothetical protein K6C35_08535 [Eubacterium sp.]|nr:hypothetical protein [Eubacterium sp.]
MKTGSISEMVLKRSVLKHIRKDKNIVKSGAALGNDAALLCIGENDDITLSEGFSDSCELTKAVSERIGLDPLEMAYIRAYNNMSAAAAVPVAALINITVGRLVKEGRVRTMMSEISETAFRDSISIIGGDTKISGAVQEDAVTAEVVMLGRSMKLRGDNISESKKIADSKNIAESKNVADRKNITESDSVADRKNIAGNKKIAAGDQVIICGNAGYYGTSNLIIRYKEKLLKKLPESFLEQAVLKSKEELFIRDMAEAAYKYKAKYVHDISNGGIYAALYQTADKAGMGIKVRHEDIPVRQETIEVSERLGINPYMLCGTGGLVIVCSPEDTEELIRQLTLVKDKMYASGDKRTEDQADYKTEDQADVSIRGLQDEKTVRLAGEITKERLRCIYSEACLINRVIEMPDGDEMYKEVME